MRILVAIFMMVVLASCDPDVAGEKITLSPVTFAFKVSNDTPYLRVGDTLNIRAAVSSTVDGIKLIDGEGVIASYLAKGESVPRVSFDDVTSALNTIDYHLIINNGGIKWGNGSPNSLIRFTSQPAGDSIIMDYTFVFLKPGLYQIGGLQPSFYEGSKGKGRWDAYFDVSDPHWDFVDMPSAPPPQPSDADYLRSYLVAVAP